MTYVSPGNNVNAADVNFLADRTIDKPICRVLASAAQAMAHNTIAALLFGAEDYDTNAMHDITTNTSRIVPAIGFPGYYELKGTIVYAAGTDYQTIDAFWRKNGTTSLAPPGRRAMATGQPSTYQAVFTTVQVFLDPGLGDYMELMGVQTNVATASRNTNFATGALSVIEAQFLRR